MTKTRAKVFLIVFGNLLTLAVGGGIFGIWSVTGWSIGLIGLSIGLIHLVFSAVSCRRFKREFDISPDKYVLYSAAPAFLICSLLVLVLIAGTCMPAVGNIAVVPLFIVIFPAVYSVCYTSVLAVAVSFL